MGTLLKGKNRLKSSQPQAKSNADLSHLTDKAQYVVDAEGRRQAVVLDWATWQKLLEQLHGNGSISQTPSRRGHVPASEYALEADHSEPNLYRPTLANRKEAADFRLESPVIRHADD
jgi:hypothetical protein